MSEQKTPPPMSRTSPLTDYERMPSHYENADVPHVLARVRFMRRFFDEVVDEPPFRTHLPELHGAYMDLLNEALAPYALDLALSLISLEDELAERDEIT